MKLYHYTCADGAGGIRRDGRVVPNRMDFAGDVRRLVWLTDLPEPDRAALGLTSLVLGCDRTEWRVTVDCDAQPWHRFARSVPRPGRLLLEMAPGARPMHWWVAETDVPALEIGRTVTGRVRSAS